MRRLDYQISALATDARAILNDIEFRAGLMLCRGKLTATHVSLESARLSLARAKEIVDEVAAEAERLRAEAGEREKAEVAAA